MKKILKYFLPVAIIACMISSCEYEFVEPEGIDPATEVSYKSDIIPIFNESCNSSGCHNAGGFDPVLTAEKAYDNLWMENQIDTVAPETSPLYQSITSGSMDDYASPADVQYILRWIEQGAANN